MNKLQKKPSLSLNSIGSAADRAMSFADIMGAPCKKQDALELIRADEEAFRIFSGFPPEHQERLLDFICGSQGLMLSYDPFFQHVFNPHLHRDRLERFLSAFFDQPVRIRQVLPREGIRLAADASLVILDIALELSNGSYIDLEMQKVGYYFPGERCSCYSADFIMRQYAKLKAESSDTTPDVRFLFKGMKPVHLIVLMEHSSKEFSNAAPAYIHRKIQYMDSGARVNFLDHVTYVSLDTFHEVIENIDTPLDAWLTFLSSDAPADIVKLVHAFPEFAEYYRDIREFRKNPKELIHMYSEVLAEMDRNTVMYMCEDMQNQYNDMQNKCNDMQSKCNDMQSKCNDMQNTIQTQKSQLAQKDTVIAEKDKLIEELQSKLKEKEA